MNLIFCFVAVNGDRRLAKACPHVRGSENICGSSGGSRGGGATTPTHMMKCWPHEYCYIFTCFGLRNTHTTLIFSKARIHELHFFRVLCRSICNLFDV